MEFTTQKVDFLREISRVQGVVERKNTIPILANVLVRAADGKIEMRATDLEVGLQTFCAAEVKTSGSVTLAARKLFEIGRALPEAPIRFVGQANHWVAIECAKSRFRMVGLPEGDFPALPEPRFDDGVKIAGATFRRMVERVIFATTSDDARYSLNGSLMILRKGFLALVASDGHRLAYVSTEVPIAPATAETRVVVPRKALAEIARLCAEIEEDVQFGQHENHLFFRVGPCTLDCRVLEGNFPNFEKVIPRDNDKDIELGTTHLADAIRRVSLLSDERARPVKIAFTPGKMEISSHSPESGEASEQISVDYTGAPIDIGFNARYLLDFLGAVGSEVVILSLKDQMAQGLLRPKDPAGQDYRYVVMPMRI